jgi:hypothetical protein
MLKSSVDCLLELGCYMRSLLVVRVGIVVVAGVLGVLADGAGYVSQAQQSTPAAKAGSNSQALVDASVKTTDDQQAASSPASERQKKLAADTDKLLALATDLKKEVDKTNKDILSVDVVKKAEEIEKLARNMKNDTK